MNRPPSYNGGCACDDCRIEPTPTDHTARLEATDDVWPTTEGASS